MRGARGAPHRLERPLVACGGPRQRPLQVRSATVDTRREMPRIALASVVALLVGTVVALELERRLYLLVKGAWT